MRCIAAPADGQGPALHLQPYPAQTPHGFKGAGDDTLRVVSVHPSATVQQTDL